MARSLSRAHRAAQRARELFLWREDAIV